MILIFVLLYYYIYYYIIGGLEWEKMLELKVAIILNEFDCFTVILNKNAKTMRRFANYIFFYIQYNILCMQEK